MADIKNSVTLTFGYGGTDFTRKYKFDGVSSAVLNDVKTGILAINASLTAGTDGGLKEFFRADDYDDSDPSDIIGEFTGIVAAQIDSTQVTEINLNE